MQKIILRGIVPLRWAVGTPSLTERKWAALSSGRVWRKGFSIVPDWTYLVHSGAFTFDRHFSLLWCSYAWILCPIVALASWANGRVFEIQLILGSDRVWGSVWREAQWADVCKALTRAFGLWTLDYWWLFIIHKTESCYLNLCLWEQGLGNSLPSFSLEHLIMKVGKIKKLIFYASLLCPMFPTFSSLPAASSFPLPSSTIAAPNSMACHWRGCECWEGAFWGTSRLFVGAGERCGELVRSTPEHRLQQGLLMPLWPF